MDIDTTANADNEWTVSAIYETVKGGREPKPFKRARWVLVLILILARCWEADIGF